MWVMKCRERDWWDGWVGWWSGCVGGWVVGWVVGGRMDAEVMSDNG